jgi:phosphatidylethanolamine/phosphatidyl-N-methylethanolamine N-methyltransferase
VKRLTLFNKRRAGSADAASERNRWKPAPSRAIVTPARVAVDGQGAARSAGSLGRESTSKNKEQRMPTRPQLRPSLDDRVVFLQEFLKHPKQIASVTPSSRFLERRIINLAEVRTARLIVELGAGTGGTTRAMLNAMSNDAKLLTIEINPRFCALLRRIDDPRFIVHGGSARDLREILSRYRLGAPDAIVSGIPFSTMDHRAGSLILESITSVLRPGGCFVAYQWSKQVDELSRPLLGPARVEVALFNIPPLRIYRWDKRDGMRKDELMP